ncbi:PadR family transcriptional regulator [Sphaerisporangium sp. NPDC049002]|uniref:PadR family transcriptional regulator n=1 Tax=unclassified Sphaerisporangium TaxID=2630420 RepID=UPI0033D51388
MSLRHTILGFLSLKPLTGYDLKKYFDASVRHFWSADQAQIYRALAQLSEDGLVQVRVIEQDGRPDRKEHHITDAGRIELDGWLRAPVERHAPREPFLARVFFAGRLPAAETAAIVDARIAAAEEQLGVLCAIAAQSTAVLDDVPPAADRLLAAATLENGIRHVAAELDWLRDLRNDLDDLPAAPARMRLRLDSVIQNQQRYRGEQL